MLPAAFMASPRQLCTAELVYGGLPNLAPSTIAVLSSAAWRRLPGKAANPTPVVRDLRGLWRISGGGRSRRLVSYRATASVFHPCGAAHSCAGSQPITFARSAGLIAMTAILRPGYAVGSTDLIRPMNARHGAPISWTSFARAIWFIPVGDVHRIHSDQIGTFENQCRIRLSEGLEPKNRYQPSHWPVPSAVPGQEIDRYRPGEGENWVADVASTNAAGPRRDTEATRTLVWALHPAEKVPRCRDVFAAAEWQVTLGGGS